MTTGGFILIMLIASIFGGLLIYGYTKEEEIAAWEQRTKIKLFRYIYNRIVAYENWRDMKKAGVKPQDVTSALFEYAYANHRMRIVIKGDEIASTCKVRWSFEKNILF